MNVMVGAMRGFGSSLSPMMAPSSAYASSVWCGSTPSSPWTAPSSCCSCPTRSPGWSPPSSRWRASWLSAKRPSPGPWLGIPGSLSPATARRRHKYSISFLCDCRLEGPRPPGGSFASRHPWPAWLTIRRTIRFTSSTTSSCHNHRASCLDFCRRTFPLPFACPFLLYR